MARLELENNEKTEKTGRVTALTYSQVKKEVERRLPKGIEMPDELIRQLVKTGDQKKIADVSSAIERVYALYKDAMKEDPQTGKLIPTLDVSKDTVRLFEDKKLAHLLVEKTGQIIKMAEAAFPESFNLIQGLRSDQVQEILSTHEKEFVALITNSGEGAIKTLMTMDGNEQVARFFASDPAFSARLSEICGTETAGALILFSDKEVEKRVRPEREGLLAALGELNETTKAALETIGKNAELRALFAKEPKGTLTRLSSLSDVPEEVLRSDTFLKEVLTNTEKRLDAIKTFEWIVAIGAQSIFFDEMIAAKFVSDRGAILGALEQMSNSAARVATREGEDTRSAYLGKMISLIRQPSIIDAFLSNPVDIAKKLTEYGELNNDIDPYSRLQALENRQVAELFIGNYEIFTALSTSKEALERTARTENLEKYVEKAKQLYDHNGKGQYTLEEIVNIAYGLTVLGEKNVKKMIEERGIVYFLRYTNTELERQMYQLDHSYKPRYVTKKELEEQANKPVMMIVYNHSDWNGAFYNNQEKFDDLSKNFNIVLWEVDSDAGFYSAVVKTTGGYGKITHWDIGGHGSPDEIQLGKTYTSESTLDLTDTDNLSKLKPLLQGSIGSLEACQTGRGNEAIGNRIMAATGAKRVIAPQESSSTKNWEVRTDQNGTPEIVDVKYYFGESSVYGER